MQSATHVVAAVFVAQQPALDALARLKGAHREGLLSVVGAAVIERDANGCLHLRERAGRSAAHSAVLGGALGATLSLLGESDEWASGVGALLRSEAALLHEQGLDAPEVAALGGQLPAGGAAVVALAGDEWLRQVRGLMAGLGARVYHADLPAELSRSLSGAAPGGVFDIEGVLADDAGALYSAPVDPHVESVYDHAHVYFDYSGGGAGELFTGE